MEKKETFHTRIWDEVPEPDNPFSPPESGSRKRKYEPRNPSPLTYVDDAGLPHPSPMSPILQLCVRHPNVPAFKYFLQHKKNISIPSQTDKENIIRREVGSATNLLRYVDDKPFVKPQFGNHHYI